MKTLYAHSTARALPGRFPFLDDALARWVWRRLAHTFPLALAANLMPDHLHFIAPDRGKPGARTLGRILGASSRALGRPVGRGRLWEEVPVPKPLTSPDKLGRNCRYSWLNPCRPWRYRGRVIQLVDDPLLWPWSSLHDSIGAIVEPWIPAERVIRAFGWRLDETSPERLHHYATHDEYVSAAGRRFPTKPPSSPLPDRRLDDIVSATLVATRLPLDALERQTPARPVLVGLAHRQGWRQRAGLAQMCGVHPSTVTRIAARAPRDHVECAALCLDPRLLRSREPILLE
jgi:hypothetical protein